VGPTSTLPAEVLPAAEGDDDGAVQDADENRTARAVVIVTVAAWSSPRRGGVVGVRAVVVTVAPGRGRASTR
jgi:hypothetical protein